MGDRYGRRAGGRRFVMKEDDGRREGMSRTRSRIRRLRNELRI
jgi:hypothetical protein